MRYYLHHICISVSSINQGGNSATDEKQLMCHRVTYANIRHIIISFRYKGEETRS